MSAENKDLEVQAEEVQGEIPAEDLPSPDPAPPPPPPEAVAVDPVDPDYDVISSLEIDGLRYELVVMRGSGQPVQDGTMQTMIVAPQVRITRANGTTEGQAA